METTAVVLSGLFTLGVFTLVMMVLSYELNDTDKD